MEKTYQIWIQDDAFLQISADVQITETEQVVKEMREMVEFWRGWEKVLKAHNNNYTEAFCYYFGQAIAHNKLNLDSISDLEYFFSNEEGFYPFFKSDWFKLLRFKNDYEEPTLTINVSEKLS